MNKPSKKTRYGSDSFLEAFRDLGNDVVDTFKNDVVKKTGKDIFETATGNSSKSGTLSAGESANFNENLYDKELELEKKYQKQARWQAEINKKQERVIYTSQERELKFQVQSLQKEIQQLVRASGQLAKEVEVASFNVPSEIGQYHLSFFERLRNLVKSLRAQVQESSFWLAEFNKKSQKRNHYWNRAKKSGTSFTLHTDRQVSTQTG